MYIITTLLCSILSCLLRFQHLFIISTGEQLKNVNVLFQFQLTTLTYQGLYIRVHYLASL